MADNEFIIDFDNYDESFHKEIMEYVKSLNEIEIKAMKKALGSKNGKKIYDYINGIGN